MRLLDPVRHVWVEHESCVSLGSTSVGELLQAGEGLPWFVWESWTNSTRAVATLPPPALQEVQRRLDYSEAVETLLNRCAVLEAQGVPPDLPPVEETPMLTSAVIVARAEGFTEDVIEAALATLDAPFVEDASVPVISLTEGGLRMFEPLHEGVEDAQTLRAIFVLGAGGSGKSTIAREMFAGLGVKFINQDKHLTRFLKQAGIPLTDAGSSYTLFKQAQQLARKEFQHFSQQRLGIVVDATGWDYQRIAKPIYRLRGLGYDVTIVVVEVTLATALKRNKQRDRVVPSSFIQTAHHGLGRNFPRYRRLVGAKNMLVLRNEGNLEPKVWRNVIGPKLRALGLEILSRPLRNRAGLAWMSDQRRAKLPPPTQDAVAVPPHLPFQ